MYDGIHFEPPSEKITLNRKRQTQTMLKISKL